MTTKVLADSAVCSYNTLITVNKEGKITKINLASTCSYIKKYDEKLGEVESKDLYTMAESKIMKKAAECNVSPICIVPAAIMNACWIENGMMSKNLALGKKELKIIFVE